MKKIIAILSIFILLLVLAAFSFSLLSDNLDSNENQSQLNKTMDHAITPSINPNNDSLIIPPNEEILTSINWSKYPIVSYYYVSESIIAEPNSIINHTFIDLHIKVGIKNPDDVPEVYKELSSIAKAEKALVGPDSSIEIFGNIEDGRTFLVGILPYSTKIYRRDYIHPVHNLTFSDIDASEVD